MKLTFRKPVSITLVFAISMLLYVPAFAADKQSEDKNTIIASAVDMADKVRPYIDY